MAAAKEKFEDDIRVFFPVNPKYDCAELNLKRENEQHRDCMWLSMMPAAIFCLLLVRLFLLFIATE